MQEESRRKIFAPFDIVKGAFYLVPIGVPDMFFVSVFLCR